MTGRDCWKKVYRSVDNWSGHFRFKRAILEIDGFSRIGRRLPTVVAQQRNLERPLDVTALRIVPGDPDRTRSS